MAGSTLGPEPGKRAHDADPLALGTEPVRGSQRNAAPYGIIFLPLHEY